MLILEIIKQDIPDLQAGAFLHLLDSDRIEGITKNTEGWLENFRGLTVFKKQVMTLKSLQQYGKGFQLKVLGSLLTDKKFLLNVTFNS